MTTRPENSTITALTTLRALQAERLADEQAARAARLQHALAARDAARVRAEAALTEAARRQAERDAAQRAAQARVQRQEAEAAIRARFEAETQLQKEQMRLDALMKLAGERPKPRWPKLIVSALTLLLGATGYLAIENQSRAADAARARTDLAAQTEQDAAQTRETLERLGDELTTISRERLALMAAAMTAAEADAAPEAEPELELEPEPEVAEPKPKAKAKPKTSPKKPKAKPSEAPADTGRPAKDRITVDLGNDPLGGL
jgi:hypothetical protein